MEEKVFDRDSLRLEELKAVYAISRAVATAKDFDEALDEIVRLSRPVFIFDNMVLYLKKDTENIEPTYARAIGRGRFREADLAWGEATAIEALRSGEVIKKLEEVIEEGNDRMRFRFLLGLPLQLETKPTGVLVFIRFGGPIYEPDQIRLAQFIAGHVSQLIGRDRLVQLIAHLEAERQLDRLQEDFIAMVSHELLTPLGFIKGYATTLLREDTTWDAKTYREFLTIIDEETDRLKELIDNLMDSSRLQAGTLKMNFQPMRIDGFLKDIVDRSISRHDNLDIRIGSDLPKMKIIADATRLAQVFDNLLTNASKYAPNSQVVIILNYENDFAHITVSDNGPGIAAEHLNNIFKRFFRVPIKNGKVSGTGLGLFICKQIISAHDGQIWVESMDGHGTTFHIKIPIKQRQDKDDNKKLIRNT